MPKFYYMQQNIHMGPGSHARNAL